MPLLIRVPSINPLAVTLTPELMTTVSPAGISPRVVSDVIIVGSVLPHDARMNPEA